MLDDCVSYLDGTIFNIQSKITDFYDLANDFDSVIFKDEIPGVMDPDEPYQTLNDDISHKLTISSKFQKLR